MSLDPDPAPEREVSPSDSADHSADAESPRTPEDKSRILIGSQRDVDQAPSKAEQSNLAEDPILKPTVAESDSDSSANATTPTIDQQKNKNEPTTDSAPPSADEAQAASFPPPRTARVSAELQAEIDEALGNVSLDELMASQSSASTAASLEIDSRHQATVVKIHRDNVFCSMGGRNEGVVSIKQFKEPPQPGTSLEVIVVNFNVDEGLYELTIPGVSISVGDWSDLSEGVLIEVLVTGHNKGGLECEVNHIRGFIPASQVAMYRVEDFEQFVNQKLLCIVTETNPDRRNLVLSRRAVLERENAEAREKLINELDVGQTHEGVVRKIQPFGAFVDLGGVDGLVHISKLSWDRVNHPSDVLQEGETISVKIDKIDKPTGKISLSYRDTMAHPWEGIETRYSTGSTATGVISRIAVFGAFVRLESGVEGLIHISELAHHRVLRVTNVVEEGQEVEVKILSVDPESQRMSLSLKALHDAPVKSGAKHATENEVEEEISPPIIPKHQGPLKGGVNRPSGGEEFGLKW